MTRSSVLTPKRGVSCATDQLAFGTPLPPTELARPQERLAPAVRALGDAGAVTARAEGRGASEQAVTIALEVPVTSAAEKRSRPGAAPPGPSKRRAP
jgi:hypothetical protein